MSTGEDNKDTNRAQGPQGPPQADEQKRRLVSRRALVRAGWALPVVLALRAPANAFASTGIICVSGKTHTDVTVPGVSGSLSTHTDVCV